MGEERSYNPLPEAEQPPQPEMVTVPSTSASASSAARGVLRSMRITPPADYTLKIESFSALSKLLSNLGKEKYKSTIFEAGGYKWRLSIYPDGDKKRNGDGFISMYLLLADRDNLPLGLDINVYFMFFVYDQIREKYLTIQDIEGTVRRYHMSKTEHGFSQFLSLANFNNSSNGYLVNDSCEFGVEVFVLKKRSQGLCLNVFRASDDWYFGWNIPNFSKLLTGQNYHYSPEFLRGGRNWKLRIRAEEDHLSLFLCLINEKLNHWSILQMLRKCKERLQGKKEKAPSIEQEHKLYVECKLRIVDQIHYQNMDKTLYGWFIESSPVRGFQKFISLSDIHDPTKGYLVNDTLIAQMKFAVICAPKDL